MRLAMALPALLAMATTARAGDVHGVVTFAGAPPQRPALPVTKDKGACGEEVPDESLLVAGGHLANVVVTVKGAPAPSPARGVLDQRRCRFVPHVQAVPLGSTEVLSEMPWLEPQTRSPGL